MPKYVVVYVNSAKSYLCKYIRGGKMYKSVAEGDTDALRLLAEELNKEDAHGD